MSHGDKLPEIQKKFEISESKALASELRGRAAKVNLERLENEWGNASSHYLAERGRVKALEAAASALEAVAGFLEEDIGEEKK